jgi:hypothetical protein
VLLWCSSSGLSFDGRGRGKWDDEAVGVQPVRNITLHESNFVTDNNVWYLPGPRHSERSAAREPQDSLKLSVIHEIGCVRHAANMAHKTRNGRKKG